jgi:hypothetical protein
MKRLLAVVSLTVVLGGCGGAEEAVQTPLPASTPPVEFTPEPGFDPDDPALSTMPEDQHEVDQLTKLVGNRKDYRIPRRVLANRKDGPLVLAVTVRPFNELNGDEAIVRRLTPGQRAVFAIYLADAEILNGGFSQFWANPSGAVGADLVPAAELVGSPEFTAIFRDAAAIWPGGEIPRDRASRAAALDGLPAEKIAELDARYAQTQYKRSTTLAEVLAPYIRAHLDQFASD